jgi:tRNA dimethylallyltransferase
MRKIKLLVIVGPTASGKSDLAVKLAKKFNGEVISADSRQVYKGLNIATGKITKKEMRGVPHYLLDIADLKRQFTVEKYKRLANKAISDISSRGKLPIICGGTGFYIDAVVNDITFPNVKINRKLREKLIGKSADQLLKILEDIDAARARMMVGNNSERHNLRRIIRAIEIATALKKVPAIKKSDKKYDVLFIGLNPLGKELKKRIYNRLIKRLKAGMIAEARRLRARGLSWKRMEELGLEYKYLARFLQRKITKAEMIEKIYVEDWRYAKRQMTWFKRNKRTIWFEQANIPAMRKLVFSFLS